MAKAADERTLKLIEEVKKRKAEIAQAEKPNYTTNMSFRRQEGARPVNLHVEQDVATLVGVVAFLRQQEAAYTTAAKELELEKPPAFEWDGFTVNEWVGDIKTRLNKVQIKAKKEALAKLEQRLDKIISPELRAEMELAAIEAELGN